VDNALVAAKRAASLKNTGEIHDLVADIYERKGGFREALNNYQEAARLDPSNDKFAFDLGSELMLHENYDAAQAIFQAAEKRFPKSSRTYVGLGTAEFMAGRAADSVDAFLKAVDLDPEFEPAYLFLGEAFTFSSAHAPEVIAKLAYFSAKDPQNFGVQFYYGASLVSEIIKDGNLANAEPALTALNRAAKLHPDDARVYYQLGEVYRLHKRLSEAASYYEKSSELDPNYPEPLYKLGQVYVRLGRHADAEKMFTRHRDVMAKEEANLYHRSSEIQSFVLKMRDVGEVQRGTTAAH
jgi:tetratricopeptide (TPR) repeat protein